MRDMLRTVVVVGIAAGLTTTGLFACGEDDEETDGGGGAPSGVGTEKQMADLSDVEYQQICEATAVVTGTLSVEEMRQAYCASKGEIGANFSASNKEAACQSAIDVCMADPAAPTDDGESVDGIDPCLNAADTRRNCSSTVGEYEACKNARAQGLIQSARARASLTCAQIVAAIGERPEDVVPAACEATKGKGCGQG